MFGLGYGVTMGSPLPRSVLQTLANDGQGPLGKYGPGEVSRRSFHWAWCPIEPGLNSTCQNRPSWFARTSVERFQERALFTHIPKAGLSFPPPGPQKGVQSYCSGDTHSRVAARRTSPGGQRWATCRSWHKERKEKTVLALVPLQV